MNWKNIFRPVNNLSPDEAKAFLDSKAPGECQLLDVRQPREYEHAHLPGSILIPLKQLSERVDELAREKIVVVYCAGGVRSRAAAQYLVGQGFERVYNMSGGIKKWQDRAAAGPEEQGLELLDPAADYADALALSWALEDGLQQFYNRLADLVDGQGRKDLLTRLAGFEDRHKEWLAEEYRTVHGGCDPQPVSGDGALMEGGRTVAGFLARLRPEFLDLPGIFDLAMMFETQALDLYSRMSVRAGDARSGDLFLRLVEEEKTHMSYLEMEYERLMDLEDGPEVV